MAGVNKKKLLMVVIPILIVIIPIIYFYVSGLRFHKVPYDGGNSMSPTISRGDIVIVKTHFTPYDISRGSIVLIKHIVGSDTIEVFKRVIAIENDQIEYNERNTYLNGDLIIEPYTHYSSQVNLDKYNVRHKNNIVAPEVIPMNKYFVMGDNRNLSFDSRDPEFGLIDYNEIIGIPDLILWSSSNSKILSTPR